MNANGPTMCTVQLYKVLVIKYFFENRADDVLQLTLVLINNFMSYFNWLLVRWGFRNENESYIVIFYV